MNSEFHTGHRNRLREKFQNDVHLEDHELLEILLYSSIPRRNTNEIAHALLQRFGSIRGIMDADEASLLEVEGIGSHSAVFLRVVSQIVSRYHFQSASRDVTLSSSSDLSLFMRCLFIGSAKEQVFLLLFNSAGRLFQTKKISSGSAALSGVSLRKIIEIAITNNAASVILVHNHPNGVTLPSEKDIEITEKIKSALENAEITLVDHFLVANDSCFSIFRSSSLQEFPS